MPYKVRVAKSVDRQIISWGLPDEVLVEVHLRLRDHLPRDPLGLLRRTRQPFDGMTYHFSLIDPKNRFCVHDCLSQVIYSQDEETLEVVQGAYVRRVGL